MTKKKKPGIMDEIIQVVQDKKESEFLELTVDDWSTEEKEFKMYITSFTIADLSYVDRMSTGDKSRSLVYTIIRKALKADGTKMFTVGDFNKLINGVKSSTIAQIVMEMNRINALDIATE